MRRNKKWKTDLWKCVDRPSAIMSSVKVDDGVVRFHVAFRKVHNSIQFTFRWLNTSEQHSLCVYVRFSDLTLSLSLSPAPVIVASRERKNCANRFQNKISTKTILSIDKTRNVHSRCGSDAFNTWYVRRFHFLHSPSDDKNYKHKHWSARAQWNRRGKKSRKQTRFECYVRLDYYVCRIHLHNARSLHMGCAARRCALEIDDK